MNKYSVIPDKHSGGFFYLYSEEPRKREVAKFYNQSDAEAACRALNTHDKLVGAMRKARDLMIQGSPVLGGSLLERAFKALDHTLADVEKEQPNVIERLKKKAAEQAAGKETS